MMVFQSSSNRSFTVRAGLAPAPADTNHLTDSVRVRAGLAPAQLTRIGRTIDEEWRKIPDFYSNIILDEYVIMPDHFHGIIIFPNSGLPAGSVIASGSLSSGAQASCALTLGRVIASFKSRCTIRNLKYAEENDLKETEKVWHRNYYEHIIRDENELSEIRRYIRNNPIEWEKNTEHDGPLLP